MIFALALYCLAMPGSAYAAGRFAVTHKQPAPENWAVIGGLFPPAGAIFAILMLTKGLKK